MEKLFPDAKTRLEQKKKKNKKQISNPGAVQADNYSNVEIKEEEDE